MNTDIEKSRKLAEDLRKGYPRSPREKLDGYVIAARCVDKCRAWFDSFDKCNGSMVLQFLEERD